MSKKSYYFRVEFYDKEGKFHLHHFLWNNYKNIAEVVKEENGVKPITIYTFEQVDIEIIN